MHLWVILNGLWRDITQLLQTTSAFAVALASFSRWTNLTDGSQTLNTVFAKSSWEKQVSLLASPLPLSLPFLFFIVGLWLHSLVSMSDAYNKSDFPVNIDVWGDLCEPRPAAASQYVPATSGQNGCCEKRPDESIKWCVCHVCAVNQRFKQKHSGWTCVWLIPVCVLLMSAPAAAL